MIYKKLDKRFDMFLESVIPDEPDVFSMIESLVIEMIENDTNNVVLAVEYNIPLDSTRKIERMNEVILSHFKEKLNDKDIEPQTYKRQGGSAIFRYKMSNKSANIIIDWFENEYRKDEPRATIKNIYPEKEKELEIERPRKEIFANNNEYKEYRTYLIRNKVYQSLLSKLDKDDRVDINKIRELQQEGGVTKYNLEQIIVKSEPEKYV